MGVRCYTPQTQNWRLALEKLSNDHVSVTPQCFSNNIKLKAAIGTLTLKTKWCTNQTLPSPSRVDEGHCWKLYDQPFALCRRFGTAYILWTGFSACTWSVFNCVRRKLKTFQLQLRWKLATKRPRSYVSQKNKPVHTASSLNGLALLRVKFKHLGMVLTSDRRQNKEIDTRIAKENAVLRELSNTGMLSDLNRHLFQYSLTAKNIR